MSRLKKLPYLLPKPDRVKIIKWNLITADGLQPVDALFPDWDAALSVHVSAAVEIDVSSVLEDCHLPLDSVLRLSLTWHSDGTGLRGRGTYIDLNPHLTGQTLNLEVQINGAVLAKSVTISVILVLIESGTGSELLAPKLPGSLLWYSEKTILLEGEGTRFPMEVIDFADSAWLPENAAWFLDWDPDDFDQPVLGAVRLYINLRHERVKQAVSGLNKLDRAIREAIRFDVARVMIAAALNNEEFMSQPDTYPDGTIGAALRRLLYILFPGESFQTVQKQFYHYPQHFEGRLQHSLKLFWDK